jgi:hypothetical protein
MERLARHLNIVKRMRSFARRLHFLVALASE